MPTITDIEKACNAFVNNMSIEDLKDELVKKYCEREGMEVYISVLVYPEEPE